MDDVFQIIGDAGLFFFSDLLLPLIFLAIWLAPNLVVSLDFHDLGSFMMLCFIFEFVFGHASVGFGLVSLSRSKLLVLFAFLLYGFFLFFVAMHGGLTQVFIFLATIIGRALSARKTNQYQAITIAIWLGFSRVMLLLACALPAAILPIPALGAAHFNFNFGTAAGLFVEQPQKMIFWLLTYYALVDLMEKRIIKLFSAAAGKHTGR